jgi:hypothetical protein
LERAGRAGAWLRPALLALLLAAFALRATALARQNIWWDEARNIDVALRPFTQIAGAPELDIQPPLYFWLLHGWLRLAGVERGDPAALVAYASRFLSVLVGVAGVALLAPLARRAGGRPAYGPGAAVLVGALAPFWLAESQEARMYTLGYALLAAAALPVLGITAGWARGQSRVPWKESAACALLAAAAVATHYNSLFVLVSWYAWWTVAALVRRGRGRRIATVAATGLGTALLLLPLAPVALRQIPTYANPNLTVPTLGEYLRLNWQAYIAGYAFDPAAWGSWANVWLAGVFLLLVVGLAVQAARAGRSGASPSIFLLVWLLGGLSLYYIAVLDRGAFNVRYASFVTPALYAALGLALSAFALPGRVQPIPEGAGKLLTVAATLFVAGGMLPFVRADLADPRFAREDMAGVTDWLRAETRPGDLILLDQKYPFGFYWQRYAVEPEATPQGDEPAPARYLFVDVNTVDERLNAWAGDARRIFWVQWFESDTDPRHAVPFLLNQAGRHAGEQWFQGYSIDWWELEPPNTFHLAQGLAPLHIAFPPAVETTEAALPDGPIGPGAPLPVVLRWQRIPGSAADRPLKARVALYDGAGNRVAQADERLLNDRHLAPPEWQPGDRPLNVYLLETPPDLPPGEYSLRLLVYDEDTLEAVGEERVIGEVVIGD